VRPPWRRNADTHDQELRRRAASGDARAAHALAQNLLRSGRLTVQDLAGLGKPAADALLPPMKAAVVRALLPIDVWVVAHQTDTPGRGSSTGSTLYLERAPARADAARRAAEIVLGALGDYDPATLDEGARDLLESAHGAVQILAEGPPQSDDAWDVMAGLVERLASEGYGDGDEHIIEVLHRRLELPS
jgi:hypothetical protein